MHIVFRKSYGDLGRAEDAAGLVSDIAKHDDKRERRADRAPHAARASRKTVARQLVLRARCLHEMDAPELRPDGLRIKIQNGAERIEVSAEIGRGREIAVSPDADIRQVDERDTGNIRELFQGIPARFHFFVEKRRKIGVVHPSPFGDCEAVQSFPLY